MRALWAIAARLRSSAAERTSNARVVISEQALQVRLPEINNKGARAIRKGVICTSVRVTAEVMYTATGQGHCWLCEVNHDSHYFECIHSTLQFCKSSFVQLGWCYQNFVSFHKKIKKALCKSKQAQKASSWPCQYKQSSLILAEQDQANLERRHFPDPEWSVNTGKSSHTFMWTLVQDLLVVAAGWIRGL